MMFESIPWMTHIIYQLIMLIFWVGIIFIIVSVFRNSRENNKRLKSIEEKVDSLIEKENNNLKDKS